MSVFMVVPYKMFYLIIKSYWIDLDTVFTILYIVLRSRTVIKSSIMNFNFKVNAKT